MTETIFDPGGCKAEMRFIEERKAFYEEVRK